MNEMTNRRTEGRADGIQLKAVSKITSQQNLMKNYIQLPKNIPSEFNGLNLKTEIKET